MISEVYDDSSGYGSVKEPTKDATATDRSIQFSDVQEWFANNAKKNKVRTPLKWTNSCVAVWPYHEYQPDLLFIKH